MTIYWEIEPAFSKEEKIPIEVSFHPQIPEFSENVVNLHDLEASLNVFTSEITKLAGVARDHTEWGWGTWKHARYYRLGRKRGQARCKPILLHTEMRTEGGKKDNFTI